MYDKSKTAIIYLGMNTKKDLLYGRDSRTMLEKSLDLLYKNYNNKFKHDVIIFYDSLFPFDNKSQLDIKKNRKEIKFIQIPDNIWKPPCNININDKNNWLEINKYPIGYRNMCRWYGISVFRYVKNLGYDWILRLDDDSYIHSIINYDLFKFMYDNKKIYGYKCLSNESIKWRKNFIEILCKYILYKKLYEKYDILLKYYIKEQDKWISDHFNLIGPYTNFFLTNVNNWTTPDVEEFLNYIDNNGGIYKYRWGDLIIHTAVINIFFNHKTHHHFKDFDYEHATFNKDNKLIFGGLFPKIDTEQNIIKSNLYNDWIKKYKYLNVCCFQHINLHKKLECKYINCPNELLLNSNISNKFIINDNINIYYIGKFHNYNDVINSIFIYLLNSYQITTLHFKNNNNVNFIWFKDTTFKLFTFNKNKNLEYNSNSKILCINVKNKIIL